MQVAGYIRCSTSEQALTGVSLEAQRDAIDAGVAQRGWELAAVFADRGVSGKSLAGRDGLAAALEAADAGDVDGLVVARIDRLSRSLIDFAAVMERSRRKHWVLVALDLGVDTSSPQGEMVASIMATFAQFERHLIGQRTKEALAVRRSQGVQLGRPRVLAQETRDRIHHARGTGKSLRAIVDELNHDQVPTAHGGRQWHSETVRRVLQSERLQQDSGGLHMPSTPSTASARSEGTG